MEDKPAWLKNAKKHLTKEKQKVPPKRKLKSKKVSKALEEAGLTVVVDDNDKSKVVDVVVDENDEDFELMKSWAEGRALSVSARAQRDAFVIEFMVDFNGIDAATRIGSSDPVNLWRRLQRCPYTQRAISKRLSDWEASSRVTRNAVCAALWREANDYVHGTSTSRVAALAKLGKIMGYEVDNINLNINQNQEFIDAPLTRGEFVEMKEVFEEEF